MGPFVVDRLRRKFNGRLLAGRRRWVKVRCDVSDFFFGTEAQAERTRDPIMDTVVEYTLEALRFIKTVMLLGSLSGCITSVPCLHYLWASWRDSASCNRPLGYWLLFNSTLQLLQSPLRLVFFLRLRYIEQSGRNNRAVIYHYLRLMTSSRAWKCSRLLSILNYGWFVLGVVWVLNSSHCEEPMELWKLSVAVIVFSMARLLITQICFFYSCPQQQHHHNGRLMAKRGATQTVIDVIPRISYNTDTAALFRDPMCSICLGDWVVQDELRLLSCNHAFHLKCVDKWLKRVASCPLCLSSVNPPDQQWAI